MKNVLLFLADGFEEIEALATVDVLRRAGVQVTTVSINPTELVTGAHGIPVMADVVYELAEFHTCRTYPACVTVTLAAEQIIGKRYCNGKFTVPSRTGNEQRMGQAVVIDTATQLLYHTPLPYYVFEKNAHQYMAFAIS